MVVVDSSPPTPTVSASPRSRLVYPADMHRWIVFLLALASSALAADPSRYTGKVGRLEAIYDIRWNSDDSVTGTYSYPSRPGAVYRLDGHNREQGKLYLEEYTGDVLSARCFLTKRIADGQILWEGEMRNTDGRVLPMTMARVRDARPNMPQPAGVETPALYSRVPRSTVWPEPPKASVPVERATMWYEGAEFVPAGIRGYATGDSSTTLNLELGVFSNDKIIFIGPTVSLSIPRALPFRAEDLEGTTAFVEISAKGELLSINLAEIAVTHYRMHDSGKFEIRAVIVPDEIFEVEAHLASREALKSARRLEFVPDKVALPHRFIPGEEAYLLMQTLRVTAEFGTAIQSTDAGPGALELESLSLDPEPTEVPWIPIGSDDAWSKTPLSQRTIQAG